MIGAALSRRSGRLKLGLRLGKPPIVVPGATLDNTLGTSTIAGTSVQNYGPGYADQLRAAASSRGYELTTLNSAPVDDFVGEVEAVLLAAETPVVTPGDTDWGKSGIDWGQSGIDWGAGSGGATPGYPVLTLTGPATLNEGNPVATNPALTLSGPATLTEGNPTSAPALTLSGPATLSEGN